MADVELFWWKKCSTCRDARAWLIDHGATPAIERDIFDAPLTETELRQLGADDLLSLLSVKSPTFKAKGLDPTTLSGAAVLALLQEDPRMIRRPLIRRGRDLVIGFDKPALERILAG